MFPHKDAIFSLKSFLPNRSSAIAKEMALNVSGNWTSRFRTQLKQLATKCGCESRRDYKLTPFGIGSSLNQAVQAFTDAYKLGHEFALTDRYLRDLIVGERFCPNSRQLSESQLPSRASRENETSVSKPLRPRRARQRHRSQKCNTKETFFQNDRGWFWWESHVMAWLLRPELGLATHVKQIKQSMDQWRPVLGLHVRHGDSCLRSEEARTARKCDSLSSYLKQVARMSMYGYKAIYIATDDAEVLKQAKAISGLKVLVGPQNQAQIRPIDNLFEHYRSLMNRTELVKEYTEVLTEMFLLADCDGLVGKFTSNIARASYSLSFGQRGCAIPFISMDSYYCSAANVGGGRFRGRSFNGRNFLCER